MKTGLLWLVIGVLAILSGLVWLTVYDAYQQQPIALTHGNNRDTEPEPVSQDEADLPAQDGSVFVPILMYHYIRDYTSVSDPLGVQLSVSPATFDQQLSELKANGYQPITLEDFANKKYGSKPIVLTFDDGYKDHYTAALPILQKHNFTGTFFIVSGFVGSPGYMDEIEIAKLQSAGMEIGGHTVGHKNLANQPYEKSIQQIAISMRNRSQVFAYPSGKYATETLDVVSGLGIKAAVTTDIGVATEKSNMFTLPRLRVKEKTDLIKRINEEISIAKRALAPSQRTKD